MKIAKRGNTRCVFLFVICLAACAQAQDTAPSCIVPAVKYGGPIITGTITEVLPASSHAPMGSVTISIDQYLRGPQFPTRTVTLPVDWTKGPRTRGGGLQTPIWYEVTLQPAERLLLMLISVADVESERVSDPNEFRATCVFELDSHLPLLPTIVRMVRIDSAEGSTKIAKMEDALSDSSPAVRDLAKLYLTSDQVRDPAVRQFVFQHFAPIALDSQSPQRIEALGVIERAYDPLAKDSEMNYKILSFISDRMGDPDPKVRRIALQYIYSNFFGGNSSGLDLAKIRLTNRAEVLQQLKVDASSGHFTREAARVLQALGPQ